MTGEWAVWISPNGVEHTTADGRCMTCGTYGHPLYVTPGHPTSGGAGYDCMCGECLARRHPRPDPDLDVL